MKHLLIVVVTLALISLTMRYLASTAASKAEAAAIPVAEEHTQPKPPPEISSSADLVYVLGSKPTPIPVAPEQHSRRTNPKHFVCRLPAEEPLYKKVGPYHSQEELREDLNQRELWVRNILAAPVLRAGQTIGIQICFKTPTPFARLGLRSGDVLLSLNQIVTKQVEDLTALLEEMKSAPSLHFRLERKGVLVPLDVQLR